MNRDVSFSFSSFDSARTCWKKHRLSPKSRRIILVTFLHVSFGIYLGLATYHYIQSGEYTMQRRLKSVFDFNLCSQTVMTQRHRIRQKIIVTAFNGAMDMACCCFWPQPHTLESSTTNSSSRHLVRCVIKCSCSQWKEYWRKFGSMCENFADFAHILKWFLEFTEFCSNSVLRTIVMCLIFVGFFTYIYVNVNGSVEQTQSVLGIVIFYVIGYVFSTDRKKVRLHAYYSSFMWITENWADPMAAGDVRCLISIFDRNIVHPLGNWTQCTQVHWK